MSPAPSLLELQQWLKWVITDPRGAQEALARPRPAVTEFKDRYTSPTESQLHWINANKILATQRLDVYAEGYFQRLLEGLSKDFPKVKTAIGDQEFARIVANYLKAFPSQFTSIDEIGHKFADFIRRQEQLPKPWIPDLAQLEWSQIEAFYAQEPSYDPNWSAALAEASESDEIFFKIHPSVRLLSSQWPIPEIIEAMESGVTKNEPQFRQPSSIVIYRFDDFYCWDEIQAPIFEALKKLCIGLSLSDATSHLDEDHTTFLSATFARWVERRLLIGFQKGKSA